MLPVPPAFLRRWCSVLLLVFAICPVTSAQRPFTMVYFDDYPPFSYRDESGTMRGIFIDVITAVIQDQMGIPISHEGYPWARAQAIVQDGQADAFCTVPSPARQKYTNIGTEPVMVSSYLIFTRNRHPEMAALRAARSYQDLRPYNFAYYIGSDWAKRVLEPPGMRIDWFVSQKQVFLMIAEGRADLTIASAEVARSHIKNLGLGDSIVSLPRVFDSQSYFLCIGKQSVHAAIINEFDRRLRDFRRSGGLARILARY